MSARERLHLTFPPSSSATMKRKALHLSEEDLNIIIDALHNQWWIRYDPDVELTVAPHHKLFQRLVDAATAFSKDD